MFRPFGGVDLPKLPYRVLLGLLAYYAFSWIVGGAGFLFLIRALGGDAGPESIVFLGGIAAVGAIVAVLSVIAPSGLGVREASMYGLVLAVASSGDRARRSRPEPDRDHGRRGGCSSSSARSSGDVVAPAAQRARDAVSAVVGVFGPTASGKTDVAEVVADLLDA